LLDPARIVHAQARAGQRVQVLQGLSEADEIDLLHSHKGAARSVALGLPSGDH